MATFDERSSVRLAAVGDLLLVADLGRPVASDPTVIFDGVRPVLSEADVVFANLECTLPGDGGTVPTEPRVISTPELVRSIAAAGVNVVALANNHMFDCVAGGFHNVRHLLDEMGIAHFGAGDNLTEASTPAVLDVKGVRLAFIGGADERSGTSRFAAFDQWGVAPIDTRNFVNQIRRLRSEVDHVIVSLHWGDERLPFPSPEQVEQAHTLVEAGAALILGHHSHVVQGLEICRGVPIIYSLGNFVACEVPYADGDRLTWNRVERTGCILRCDLTANEAHNISQIPTYYDGFRVQIDRSGFGNRVVARANRALSKGVTIARYRRAYFWVKIALPMLRHLYRPQLKQLRPARVRRALARLVTTWQAGRGSP